MISLARRANQGRIHQPISPGLFKRPEPEFVKEFLPRLEFADFIRMKHEAGKRSKPAECVVSYSDFQDFPPIYSGHTVQQNVQKSMQMHTFW